MAERMSVSSMIPISLSWKASPKKTPGTKLGARRHKSTKSSNQKRISGPGIHLEFWRIRHPYHIPTTQISVNMNLTRTRSLFSRKSPFPLKRFLPPKTKDRVYVSVRYYIAMNSTRWKKRVLRSSKSRRKRSQGMKPKTYRKISGKRLFLSFKEIGKKFQVFFKVHRLPMTRSSMSSKLGKRTLTPLPS